MLIYACEGIIQNSMSAQMDGVFNYMNNWSGGECGIFNGDLCAHGNDCVSGDTTYYDYIDNKIMFCSAWSNPNSKSNSSVWNKAEH